MRWICAVFWLLAAFSAEIFDQIRGKEYPLSYARITDGDYLSVEESEALGEQLWRSVCQEWVTELYAFASEGR